VVCSPTRISFSWECSGSRCDPGTYGHGGGNHVKSHSNTMRIEAFPLVWETF
jgi:hypothetical protein